MKKILIILAGILILNACNSKLEKNRPIGKEANFEDLIHQSEPKTLAEVYFEHGNIINTQLFPPIVKASDVLKNGKNWLLIDIRSSDAYEQGHINGAYNIPKEEILNFLTQKQKAAAYPKVVFICYSGQTASYVTGITRYAGFDNTYVLLYGMAGWNSKFSNSLKKGFGDRYNEMIVKGSNRENLIVTEHHNDHITAFKKNYDLNKIPQLPKKTPSILIKEQAQKMLKQKRPGFLLKADEFFPELKKDINKFYTICYLPKPKYYVAHIKGAHQFTPRKDLSLDTRLTDLPIDKPILIYCKTGHTGGNVAAYLDMLGYDSKNLIFGSASFMYSLWKEKGWIGDINNVINDFPIVEGKKRTNNKIIALPVKNNIKQTKTPVIKKRKKEEVSGGCG